VPQTKLCRVELTQTEHFALRPSEPDSGSRRRKAEKGQNARIACTAVQRHSENSGTRSARIRLGSSLALSQRLPSLDHLANELKQTGEDTRARENANAIQTGRPHRNRAWN
jgi:hypothetical protein